MSITVVGLGKIGLPLAVQYSKKGKNVFGIDTNEETVKKVNQGIEPFPGEENLSVFLNEVITSGRLSATSNYEKALETAETIVIATPLLIDELDKPDFTILDAVSQSIGLHIRKGTLVILETTVPIGTTRDRLSVNIEKYSSLQAGKDFWVAFSPERVFTGRIFRDLKRYPKLVGGINEESGMRAKEFYETVLDFDKRSDLERENGVWLMQTAEAAEFSKLAETTYRDVNIALANQFAKHASQLNLNIDEIIEASNSQPFSHLHKPGIWVGGHCIPVYPHLYAHTDKEADIVNIARRTNLGMCEYVIERVRARIGNIEGLSALILGVSYREGVKEIAHSGVFELVRLLSNSGVSVSVFDPMYSDEEVLILGLKPFRNDDKPDLIFIQTACQDFLQMDKTLFERAKLIFDGRRLIDNSFETNLVVLRI
jgi:UDP-N-acetyl-D-glucosamine dehydrogenase